MKYKIVRENNQDDDRPNFSVSDPVWDLNDVVLSDSVQEHLEDIVCYTNHTSMLFDEWEFRRFMKSAAGRIFKKTSLWG